ncbi:hypothetical protein DPMN_075981 [Dreissena polymorpha]|uniref:Uncharacterized protein n=1 Tax=Dreissena polymorpha TaxID=45954 RepID=A0A9D4BN05_DREPO|nr:hypothetical protein DPMN_075981 [Dreissena polymorpha]
MFYIHIEKNAPPTGGHDFSPISPIFEIVRDINKTNVLPTFMMIGQKFPVFLSSTFKKTAPLTGGHVFQRTFCTTRPSFELDRDFIGTKLLTKFHEDRTINVASRVLTNQMWTTDGRTDRRRIKTGHKSSPEQSSELKNVLRLSSRFCSNYVRH